MSDVHSQLLVHDVTSIERRDIVLDPTDERDRPLYEVELTVRTAGGGKTRVVLLSHEPVEITQIS